MNCVLCVREVITKCSHNACEELDAAELRHQRLATAYLPEAADPVSSARGDYIVITKVIRSSL